MAAFKLLALLVITICVAETGGHWFGRRRRRRRSKPRPVPPEPPCEVSGWSNWNRCSLLCNVGVQTRFRQIGIPRTSPHCRVPTLSQERSCGVPNGGCSETCNTATGACSCRTGYGLARDGRSCRDIDECQPNSGRGPCSHACANSPGSYTCSCPTGYFLTSDRKTCQGKDCSTPQLPSCHTPMYSDHMGRACEKVTVSCPAGTRFNAQCRFICLGHFSVAKITDFSLPFSKVVPRSSFSDAVSLTTCGLDGAGSPAWSNHDVFSLYYFCRRVNDPPKDIRLSNKLLEEHSPVGTIVGHFSVEIPNDDDGITYSMEHSAGEFFFRVQGRSVRNTWTPRWNNLQGLKINDYRIIIRATDNGNPPMWLEKSFNITITNVNDPPDSIRISNNSVMDTAPLDHVVGVLSAVDYDGPRGSLRSSDFIWTITDDDKGRFKLQGPNVLIAASLDHQAHYYHRIIVKCTDRDSKRPRSTQISIIINVINTNDSPKDVNFVPYHLYENATAGFVVGYFVASDEDGDVLAFSLAQSNPDTLTTFELGQTSCVKRTLNGYMRAVCNVTLVLKRSVDYEAKNSYPVRLTTTDPSGGLNIGDFTVHVTNLNEAPTDVTLTKDSVYENSAVGTFVGQLIITDPDTTQRSHQTHVCNVNPSKPFAVNGVNLVVSENVLNFEKKSSYGINITCSDSGVPPLTVSTKFTIRVLDRNEKPEYLSLTHSFIVENAPIGSTVGQLLTRDPDHNTRSLSFQVRSPGNSPFAVGGAGNAYLVSRSNLDHETLPEIELLISVTDDGGLSFENYFKIKIIDENEAPTDILLTSHTLPENSQPGAIIGGITVVDPDVNSTVSCLIVAGDSKHFAVHGLNLVAGYQIVDYEALGSSKSLSVTLGCRDEFGLYVDKVFFINIQDVNEPPTNLDVTLNSIPENKIDAVGGRLRITDPDAGQTYSCKVLSNQTESLLFKVDGIALMVKTRQQLDFETKSQYDVTFQCADRTNGNYSQFTIFKDDVISVTDANEVPSNPCQREILVDEAASNGYVVWTFTLNDPDNEKYEMDKRIGLPSAHPKQVLAVSMASVSRSFPFHISGDKYLVKSKDLSRSVKDLYDLNINVTDDGMLLRLANGRYERYQGPINSAQYTCKVRVLASGDPRLSLNIALSSNSVREDALNGTTVGTLSIINPKPGKTYEFSLVQPDAVPLKVVGTDLILVIGAPLDYETSNSTGVGILAVDSDGMTVQRMFELEITNVNERPVKICLHGNKTVTELEMTDQVIGQIFIEDEDHKESKGICNKVSPFIKQSQNYSCEIESNFIAVPLLKRDFYVDESLVLHGNTTFDHKAKPFYLVPLMCRDRQKPIHIIDLIVRIRVIESTVKPAWDFILSSNTVSEDAINGTEVGTLSVVNAQSAVYTFSIPDVRKPFRIVGTKLLLVNSQPLDYETSNQTSVVIVSTDSSGARVVKSFTIIITNVNERPVNLCLLDSIAVIPEKAPLRTVIGRIYIEDPDDPESKGVCKQHSTGGAVKYHVYLCEIYSGSISVSEIKKKFYIDQKFQLNRKGDFEYKAKHVYNIPVMCRDRLKPIHLIERVFVVNIQAPSCQTGLKLVNGVCVCANDLFGPKCDRDPYICGKTKCGPKEVCVSHTSAYKRCVPIENQVPILMQAPFSLASPLENRFKIEAYVESIFEGRRPSGQKLSSLFTENVVSRQRREIPKDVYVEGATWQKVLLLHTYAIFVAMDPNSEFKPLPGSNLCALLKGSDLRCVNEEDCNLLKQAGIPCPYAFGGTAGDKGKSKGGGDDSSTVILPVAYGVASVGIAIIAVAILIFFVLRRRRRKRKSGDPVHFRNLQDPYVAGIQNSVYSEISPNQSPQIPPGKANNDLTSRNNILAQPNSTKTFKNELNRTNNVGKYDHNNPIYDVARNQPPSHDYDYLHKSAGKNFSKKATNIMLEEERAKSREKGFDGDVVTLPSHGKGKWDEPEYAQPNIWKDGKQGAKSEKKQNNLVYEEQWEIESKDKNSTC